MSSDPRSEAAAAFQVVREGNPGHRPVSEGVRFPPSNPTEPDWENLLPGDDPEAQQVRVTATNLWRRTAPTLVRSVGLVAEQQQVLVDYCITYARIVQGERALSRDGVVVRGRSGRVKNPWVTVVNQYRANFRWLAGELGLNSVVGDPAGSPARPGRRGRPVRWGVLMPRRAMQVCIQPGCPRLVARGRCDEHKRQYDRARGSSSARGYGYQHRVKFREAVIRKHPVCQICHRAPSTDADHFPLTRAELVAAGFDADSPHSGRGLRKRCHAIHTNRSRARRTR